MRNLPLSWLELLQLARKTAYTLADLEQVHGRVQPDGSRTYFHKVAPTNWASLAIGADLAIRVKGNATLLSGAIVANRLAHPATPVLVLRSSIGQDVLTLHRQQLRELRRIDFHSAPTC